MQLIEVYWYVHGFSYPWWSLMPKQPLFFFVNLWTSSYNNPFTPTICNRKCKKQYVYFTDTCKHIHVFLNPNFKIVQVNIFSIIIFFVTFILIYCLFQLWKKFDLNFLSHCFKLTFQSLSSKMKYTVVIVRICNAKKATIF